MNSLSQLEEVFPGCKDLLVKKGLSVQSQDRYPLRTPIDQRGEQTINRDAKTSGGIKFFVSDSNSIVKWTLNRPYQAQNTEALYKMADLNHANDDYKASRPSQILKSEKHVKNLIKVLTNDFVNPFDTDIDKDKLFNLSSGVQVEASIAEDILNVKDLGTKLYTNFVESRIKSTVAKIHDPIKRQKCSLFKNAGKKVKVNQFQITQTLEVNRQILSKLLALTAKYDKPIDFAIALKFPLCPVPLSLAYPDGTRRKTTKSSLMNIVTNYCNFTDPEPLPAKQGTVYIVDLMALIRMITRVPETYADLANNLFETLPKGYHRIDIIADTYKKNSLKCSERDSRGISEKVMVRSASSRIPRNFSDFLKNGENKTRLIEIIKDELIRNSREVLATLLCTTIYFSLDMVCYKITSQSVTEVPQLSSNQEEADTKLLLHTKHAIDENLGHNVIVCSPSGDVDINILFLAIFQEQAEHIWIDYGRGEHRKVLHLASVDMDADRKTALIGYHAVTGNDYIS